MNELKASGNFQYLMKQVKFYSYIEPIVEINQALNGIEGQELMTLSHFMIDTRYSEKIIVFNLSHKKNGNYEGTYKKET